MKVSKLIQHIGKCRDIIARGDYNELIVNLYLFEKVYNGVKNELDNFIKNPRYELDFTYHDLMELSDEIADFIRPFPQRFRCQKYIDKMSKLEKINNNVLKRFTTDLCGEFLIDTKLRETQKIISYCGCIQWLWQENYNQNNPDLDVAVTEAIREFLKC